MKSADTWFGQPKGLTVLFLTEMWEKFSFFGMRALQIYYMTKQLHYSPADASLVYGAYAAGVYLTPSIGMCLGLVIYLAGARHLPPDQPGVAPVAALQPQPAMANRRKLLLLVSVGLAVILFRSAYEQTGNALALWTDTSVHRAAFGMQIPATWFQSLNPLFVFMLSPMLVSMWNRRAARGQASRDLPRMSLGRWRAFRCWRVACCWRSTRRISAARSGSGAPAARRAHRWRGPDHKAPAACGSPRF